MSWHKPVRRVDIAETWKRAKADFAAVKAERDSLREELAEAKRQHQLEIDWLSAVLREVPDLRLALRELREERDEAVDHLNELRAIVDARQATEERLTELYRQREIARARAAERQPRSSGGLAARRAHSPRNSPMTLTREEARWIAKPLYASMSCASSSQSSTTWRTAS